MQDDAYKEVNFYEYCRTCEHFEKDAEEDPCCDCLAEPVNLNSHKPVNWEERT